MPKVRYIVIILTKRDWGRAHQGQLAREFLVEVLCPVMGKVNALLTARNRSAVKDVRLAGPIEKGNTNDILKTPACVSNALSSD